MNPDYPTMLRTVANVQGAMAATCVDLAARWIRFSFSGVATVVGAAVEPLRAAPEHQQAAIEDGVWTAYIAHEEVLRSITGAWGAGLLIFLNELDRRRGPKPAFRGITYGEDLGH